MGNAATSGPSSIIFTVFVVAGLVFTTWRVHWSLRLGWLHWICRGVYVGVGGPDGYQNWFDSLGRDLSCLVIGEVVLRVLLRLWFLTVRRRVLVLGLLKSLNCLRHHGLVRRRWQVCV